MKCVLLCAGKGTRMAPLTDTVPKPLINICGKSILSHIVGNLPIEVDELVLVVGYRQEQIREHCGENFMGRTVTYVEQENFAGGTGDALLCARDVLSGTFLFLNGDDIYGKEALAQIVQEEHAIFSMISDTPERFGVLVKNEDGTLKEIIEKPKNPTSNIVNIGGYVINDSIFKYDVPVSESGELYVTDFISMYAQHNPVKIIEQDLWLPIGYPEHIRAAEEVLCPSR
jgi:UDP-N-acetylglucosamine diphosphorylase / glucose-1-phosphate thymidylyltransferase / UDP-N-acetylgalactosamine diphosphorylase / glucosamine-1-phosphate N-acetyltransferase / galactosamine-1-phosphate N-acetyltransferase